MAAYRVDDSWRGLALWAVVGRPTFARASRHRSRALGTRGASSKTKTYSVREYESAVAPVHAILDFLVSGVKCGTCGGLSAEVSGAHRRSPADKFIKCTPISGGAHFHGGSLFSGPQVRVPLAKFLKRYPRSCAARPREALKRPAACGTPAPKTLRGNEKELFFVRQRLWKQRRRRHCDK